MSTAAKQTLGFQAEVKQLLDLMIHSLYSNKEIFLRELISNAADAADKLRFEAISNAALYESDPDLSIRISYSKNDRTLTVSDNGIGMSREEVVQNIGTIARSGTREFVESLSGDQAKDAKLIGQFGVGFYSSFIVADRVTLVTRRAGLPAGEAVRWECDMQKGTGEYTVEPAVKQERGTEVILHLREGEDDFLGEFRLKGIVQKYSDHIAVPVIMGSKPVNQASALWTRPKSEITDEQYAEFYRHVAHDEEAPLAWTHNRVEGRQEYTQLLYVPSRAPFDLWDRHQRRGLKLYVRRVFIMDDAEHLLPAYLRFVRGVVDSADLPLNISREILQQSRDVDAIRAGCAKRVLGMLDELSKDAEKYARFWNAFGRVLKEGPGEDPGNREAIGKLLRFSSTGNNSEVQDTSLADYVGRMQEGQEKIYYVTAETFPAAKNSPHLEIFRQRGIEVLLLSERVDEWLVAGLTEFDGKPLASVARGDLDLGKVKGGEEKEEAAADAGHKALLEKLKEALGERVKEVRVSRRLTESPSCLVSGEHDLGANLARILKAAGQKVPAAALILEVNPGHEIVKRLEPGDVRFADWANLLYDQALLAEGGQLEDPAGYVRRANDLMLALVRMIRP